MALTKITTGLIAANTLATANIADNSVDATKIAANSILTRHIDDDQVTGDQLADNITIAGNLVVSGNLTTNGSSVTNSSSNTTIEDNIIELGTGTSGSPSSDSGIVIERGSSNNAFMGWDESADKFILGTGTFTGASTGNLTITAAPLVTGALTASGLSFPTSDGSAGQVISTDGSGALSFADNTTKVDNYTATGNGSTTAFDTGTNPGNEVNTWIFVDGVYQQKSQYSYSGSTVTFSTAPENGALIDVITGTSSNITASDTVLGVYEATTSNTDAYSTGISAANENNTWVFVGGVYQPKDSYTFSSGTLTFDANTPTGQKLSVVATKTLTAGTVDTASLAANAISSAKIASNAILSRHIVNNSIVGADISATTQITANTFTGALTGNVTGNVAGNLTGTILTAAQTNITSVGTLSAATVSGQLTAGGLAYPTSDGSNEQVLKTDGSGTISFGTVSGTTINNNTNNYVMTGTGSANTLNGESGLTYDGSTLAVTGAITSDSTVTTLTNFNSTSGNDLRLNAGSANRDIFMQVNGSTLVTVQGSTGDVQLMGGNQMTNALAWYNTTAYELASIENVSHTSYNDSGGLLFKTAGLSNSGMAERMRIDSSGNVGIGTGSPSGEFHVDSGLAPCDIHFTTGSSGGTGYDVNLSMTGGANNAEMNLNMGISGDADREQIKTYQSTMRFRTNNAERMRIDSSGHVLVGKTSAAITAAGTEIRSNGEIFSTIPNAYTTNHVYSTAGAYRFYVTGAGQIHATSNSISGISDERLKENIVDLETGLAEVMSLQPRRFDWKNGDGENVAGFIAQEVETILPDLIGNFKHDSLADAKSLRMGDMLPTLVKAIQEQQTIIDDLKSRIETLEE